MTNAAQAIAARTKQNETDIEVLTALRMSSIAGIQAQLDELTMVLATRFDQFDATTGYLGDSDPGVATSAASWRVRKLTFGVDGDVDVTWADGDSNFDNVWDDRTTLTYS